jgi:uncharacterized YigZ family protein
MGKTLKGTIQMLYKSIRNMIESEFTEKKSRFICILSPAVNEDEAADILADVRRRYPAATHYCFAWRIKCDAALMEKYSDDGEPSSTAGVPMLNVLKMQEIENVIAVVVRYFGGTLLGTGGLVRAYSHAVIQTLEQSDVVIMEYSRHLKILLDYSYYSNFQNKCLSFLIKLNDTQFTDQVTIDCWVTEEHHEALIKILDKITDRSAVVEYVEQDFIAS